MTGSDSHGIAVKDSGHDRTYREDGASALGSGWRADKVFCSEPQALGAVFLAAMMAYAFQGLIPVFNNDDVRQVQPPETMAMITQGRWLYYFIFNKAFGQNPVPGLSTFVGSACLVGAAWMHARLIGLKHPTSVLILGVVSSISIYYGYMFDFDSTRIAYPLGNLLSALGLMLVCHSAAVGPRAVGVVLLGLSPALYPATLMYQVTLLVSAALLWCLRHGGSRTLRGVVRGLISIAAGVIVYVVLTTVLYAFVGFELDDRGSLNPLGLADNWETIEQIFIRNAVPFVSPDGAPAYFSSVYSYTVLAIFITFFGVLVAIRRSGLRPSQIGLVLAGFTVLLFSPFFMIAFTETDYYPIRSLYSFAAVYGALLAITFECSALALRAPARRHWMSGAVLLIAASFAFTNASLVGQKSYDQALAWQSDVAHVNRIIYRIDEVIGAEPPGSALKAPSAQIPIVVLGDTHWRSGPRGDAVSAWLHPWSKENIFSLIDNRFVPATPQERARAIEVGADRDAWPDETSVLIDGDVVIVVR